MPESSKLLKYIAEEFGKHNLPQLLEKYFSPLEIRDIHKLMLDLGREWKCPACQRRIRHSYSALGDVGNPICNCGADMELTTRDSLFN